MSGTKHTQRTRSQSTEAAQDQRSAHAGRRVTQDAPGREKGAQSRTEQFDLTTVDVLNVIAIDPGETTGYAHGKIIDGQMVIATGQAKWSHSELLKHLQWYQPHIIVYETFDFRRHKKAQRDRVNLYAKELIGVIELYEQMVDFVILHEQRPSQVMGKIAYFNHQRLKEEGIYKPNKKHANEAVRHLLYWFNFGKGYKYNKKGYVVAT